jgi:hypothetical protein
MAKPWFAILWFGVWGIFQTYAVLSILTGKWKKPSAFPEEAYHALIYPDMVFIPLYFLTCGLLLLQRQSGYILGFISGGAIMYVLIYLLALAKLKGVANLIADGLFLFLDVIAVTQMAYGVIGKSG